MRPARLRRGIGLGLAALVLAFIGYQGWFLAHILYWRNHDPNSTSFIEARLEFLHEKRPGASIAHQWVPYNRVSAHLKRAVIAAEDAKFVAHEGFDWEGIQKAMEKNQRRGRVVAGGSTITQQLAKNLFLSGERSVLRKGQEAIITAMLEAFLGKRRILELYLNVVEWGDTVFGAEAAARHYFGTGAAQLNAEQSARLAAMLPRPRFYERRGETEYLAQRAETILARMPSAQVP